ncbi:MarR family winged helix-turn-helix transcriptional regulator [Pelagovum pacificum]|uniref:MarR family transcriptional regulator n=1 Tax=Pelagovum pacificum TaxID=2588711 RepID=A0A5C5GEZ9_9RHOB|nr:MarR family transcriptional regulator [Pelagovum pacificum]QQA43538.1 MarR family transcriptional regulator [Pelagovum pacificum]TNY33325.1 MarR family transcriptional regulator [Pelagovum pacificum]
MTDSSFDRTRSAGYLANHMARLFAQRLHERIRPLGLAPAQFMTLLELWEEDGLTQRELFERLDVEQATMANTLARMQRDGLIERRAHATDARARTVHLTTRARDLRGPAQAAAREVNAMALGDLKDDDLDLFVSTMRSAVERLKAGDTG